MPFDTRHLPKVSLQAFISDPYDLAVATARTCYSSKGIIKTSDVSRDEAAIRLRDKISDSTREAGHLTTRQHAHFVFAIENVSRQFIWSFLHSHPFYNSEQVSQRYVKVAADHFTIPPIKEKQRQMYASIIKSQMQDYENLIEILFPFVCQEYFRIFPGRKKFESKYKSTLDKKTFEIARYVLPIATQAYLYHTISALTLMRYHKLINLYDTPWEQRLVVDQMVQEVCRLDPNFQRELSDSYPLEATPEFQYFQKWHTGKQTASDFIEEFDASLDGHYATLIDYSFHAPRTIAQAVRSVLGLPSGQLSDTEAIALVLDPKKNAYLTDTLHVNSLSKLSRTLLHAHYSFRKKISHTADSQDQRHRMTPASRPILEAHYTGRPDYIIPKLISQTPEALEYYQQSMQRTFEGIEKLLTEGVSKEFALYLLPNAFPIRFEESGDLLNLQHKWHTRLCHTAQEEIFYASLDEVRAVQKVHPELTQNILAPCYKRKCANVTPVCAEDDRYCGGRVWKKGLDEYARII